MKMITYKTSTIMLNNSDVKMFNICS